MATLHLLFLLVGTTLCGALQKQSLNGQWSLNGAASSINVDVPVPGGIFSNLMDSDIIDNVFFGYGDVNNTWVGEEEDWTYTTTFTVDESLLAYRVVSLVFEGLDTFATISVNGVEIGSTDNMFVRYVFSIKNQLQVGPNELSVKFASAVSTSAALANDPSNPYLIPPECPPTEYQGICHVNRIRKMQASFSWDWGPAFASVGIWKDVYLQGFDNAVIDYVVATPVKNPDQDVWTLIITTYLDGGDIDEVSGSINATLDLNGSKLTTNVEVHPKINEKFEIAITTNMDVDSNLVNLWWPNGYGTQDLYNLTVVFIGETEQSEKTVRVGFRTIELVQDELEQGLTFYLKVNDQPIFMKGANEIPINVLPEKGQDPATIRYLLKSAKDVHMNMLRVWGGGVYESDTFYDTADEFGLLIWQDFMFACAMYPTDEKYLSSVQAEVRHQAKRLGSHPSLALLSGNNENEGALRDNWYQTNSDFETYKQDYVKLYVEVIGQEVSNILPNTGYVTSSPTDGDESVRQGYVAERPGDPNYGDVHFYDYSSDSWKVSTFPIPRFSSEYGYQSMPSITSWNTATESLEDLKPDSAFLLARQHHPDGNQQNINLINLQMQLPDPDSENYVKAFIYFSQILQAQSIKTETEHYRSFKGRVDESGRGYTMGALYWQLNDVWVAPTWAGIEFTGKWKMLHYQARDFFNPMIVTGRLTTDDHLEIYAVLDDLQVPDFPVKALMHIYKWDSLTPLVAVEFPVTLDTASAVLVTTVDAPTAFTTAGCGIQYSQARKNCFFHLHLLDQDNNHLVPFNYVFPETLKDSALVNANVQIESVEAVDEEGLEFDIVVSTDFVALFVWLDSNRIPGTFSDNGFLHVLPTKTVRFTSNEATTVEKLSAELTVTHLRDVAYL